MYQQYQNWWQFQPKSSKGGTYYIPITTRKDRLVSSKDLNVLNRYARRYRLGRNLTAMWVVSKQHYTMYEFSQV